MEMKNSIRFPDWDFLSEREKIEIAERKGNNDENEDSKHAL